MAELEKITAEQDFAAFAEPSSRRHSRRSSGDKSAINWISHLFARSPKTINEKRDRLLSKSRSSSPSLSTGRPSSDLESQASTLYESGKDKRSTERLDPRVVSDAIIGLSDGLTVPFALTAGLSALGNTRVVIFAGLAELTAGAISMGLGGYLAATSEDDAYRATLGEVHSLVDKSPEGTATSIREIFEPYDFPADLTNDITVHLSKSPDLANFLMRFQHHCPPENGSRAISCALTIASGYFLGGFMPLIPYFLVGSDQITLALYLSFGFMAISLFFFGFGKTCFVGGWAGPEKIWAGTKGGLQMMLVGGTAAICAMSLVRVFDSFAAPA